MFWLGLALGFCFGELAMSGVLVLLAAGVRRQRVEPPAGLEDELENGLEGMNCVGTQLTAEMLRDAFGAEQTEKRRKARARWN